MMPMLMLLAADTSTDTSNSIDLTSLLAPILSTGIVGVVLIMLIFEIGFITKRSADRERSTLEDSHRAELAVKDDLIDGLKADVSELKLANAQLQTLTQDKMIPALVQATEVSRAYVTELARRNDRNRDGS